MIQWKTSKRDMVLIHKIAKRAVEMAAKETPVPVSLLDMDMDITACHLNGTPLDLKKLLAADDFTFAHDVFGIRKNLNRKTGKLENFFLPRCA